jgi:glycosyltransferase involved in cell wall biosynthesis
MKYEVTIGIPVYKAIDYIERTMESALNQTFASIEYLIVDDYGNDGTINVIERFQREHQRGKDIRILYNKQNLGVGRTRNIILEQARGDYLFFLDSDDIIDSKAIEKMMFAAQKYQAQVVYGSWTRVDNVHHSPSQNNIYPSMQFFLPDELAMYAFKNYSSFRISVCNALFSLNMIRLNHLRFLDTIYWEDLVFTFDLVTYVDRAVLLSDITYSYICRSNSLSHYQQRYSISKEEILQNIKAIDHLKDTSSHLISKVYYPDRCYNIGMTNFYIACNILKHRKIIHPSFSNKEIKKLMSHPATLQQIHSFRQGRFFNYFLYLLGKLPPFLCVAMIWLAGKVKKTL